MGNEHMTEIFEKKAVSFHLVLNFFEGDTLNVSAIELLELGK